MAATSSKERTRLRLEISFLDDDNTPVQPTTARWRAYCETTQTDITEWAPLAVGANGRIELQIPAAVTAIIRSTNESEEKIIAVEADEGTDNQVSAEHSIVVTNLRKTD